MALPVPTSSEPARSRRAILAGAIGGVAGLIASRLGNPGRTSAAAGGPVIMGAANSAGTTNTSLTTASSGTALLVTQNGTGTALRGSAVGPGSIAGFFTAQNGTGISGVTGNPNSYGVFAQNNGAAGAAGALRANGGQNHGIVASTANGEADGVRGVNTAADGSGVGVYGEGPTGVHGISDSGTGVSGDSTSYVGVFGTSASGIGVWGGATSDFAVYGISVSNHAVVGSSTSKVGVFGTSTSDDGILGSINTAFKSGIVGVNPHADGWAGYFEGNVVVTGTINGAVSVSQIDHPLDPANQTLAHAFVGSPDMLNIYRGTVTTDQHGRAVARLPGYFEALNSDVHYQLTIVGPEFAQAIVESKAAGNRFTIATDKPNVEVCWQVTGTRRDAYAKANPIAVEARKPADRRGRYLNPAAHGQPESKGRRDLPGPLAPRELPAR
jgi:hypothetical protein